MKTAVDTNVFLALLYDDGYADTSETELRRAYQAGKVVITPIVYAELAADGQFSSASEVDTFLEDFSVQVDEPSREALFAAGEAFRTYVNRRPDGMQCPACGAKQNAHCSSCGETLAPRQHIAADFLIGGHAVVDADELVSFDAGFYDSYFPSLTRHPK